MKTIREATKQMWWVGKVVTCGQCDQQVQLEDGDQHSTHLVVGDGVVGVCCSNCMETTYLPDPDRENLKS